MPVLPRRALRPNEPRERLVHKLGRLPRLAVDLATHRRDGDDVELVVDQDRKEIASLGPACGQRSEESRNFAGVVGGRLVQRLRFHGHVCTLPIGSTKRLRLYRSRLESRNSLAES